MALEVESMALEVGTSSVAVPPPQFSLAKKMGAEFVGTFILTFSATGTGIMNQKTHGSETLLGLAATAGLAVMIVILSIGHISGAHINPSVTIAFAAFRHFPRNQVPAYIASQVLASICASFLSKAIFHPVLGGGEIFIPSGGTFQVFLLEFIIGCNLMFVATAVATDTRAAGELAGIAVGGTVMLNVLLAGPTTGAAMNPAVRLGPAIAAHNYRDIWVYLIAPTFGALVGAAVYSILKPTYADGKAQDRSSAKNLPY